MVKPFVCRLALAMLLVSLGTSDQASCQQTVPRGFPQHSRSISPNGRYVLVNVNTVVGDDIEHTVFLEDRRLKTRRKIFEYGRSVEVLWNPNSGSFALTDYGGSDFATCSIVSVDEDRRPTPVSDDLVEKISPREKESIQRNDHLYFAAVQWSDSKTLRIKVWGHDSERGKGFLRFYRYEVGGHVKRDEPQSPIIHSRN